MNEYENFKNMANVSRGQALLEKWARDPTIQLTEEGKQWLIIAGDPFHDDQVTCSGFPDVSTGSSLIQVVRQSVNVSATSGGGSVPGAAWDMHVGLVPTMNPVAYTQTAARDFNGFTYDAGSAGSMPFGGLMARASFATGTNVDWFPPGGVGNTVLGGLSLDAAYSSGLSRIIGIGFEVINTTAVIARQGSCCVYRQVEPDRQTTVFTGCQNGEAGSNALKLCTFGGVPMRVPPRNVADAMLLAGSRQYAAEKGCYCVGAFHSNQNPPQPTSYTSPVWYEATQEDVMTRDPLSTENRTALRIPVPKNGGPVGRTVETAPGATFDVTLGQILPQKIYPFHQFGAIFSGLSPTSTFTINMNVYVEQFPSVSDKRLIVMAKPSARFDPMALEIYSHMLSVLPVGVPVSENGLGTWFSNLVAEIEPFITPLLTAFNPGLGMISKGVGIANNSYRASQKPKKPQKSLMITAPGGKNNDLQRTPGKRKKTRSKNERLYVQSRGAKGKIQGPFNK